MFDKSTFPLTAAPRSHTGSHACGQSGVKSKNLLTQTKGRPRVPTFTSPRIMIYTDSNNFIQIYRGVSWTKIGARNKSDVHNNDSPAEPTPPKAQSVSVSSSRRKGRAKIGHFKLAEDTSAVRTSGIITTMTLTL